MFCCLTFAIIKCVYDSELCAGVRDYIHVVDLAAGHVAALKKLRDKCCCQVLGGLLAVQTIHVAFDLLLLLKHMLATCLFFRYTTLVQALAILC
jgi:hypothetical protein